MPFDEDPDDRDDLFQAFAAIAFAVLVVPGLIWWLGTFIAAFTGERPW